MINRRWKEGRMIRLARGMEIEEDGEGHDGVGSRWETGGQREGWRERRV